MMSVNLILLHHSEKHYSCSARNLEMITEGHFHCCVGVLEHLKICDMIMEIKTIYNYLNTSLMVPYKRIPEV